MLIPQLLFLRKLQGTADDSHPPRMRRPAPGQRTARDRRWWRRQVVSVLLLAAGVFSAGFGLESFLLPGGFLDGGVTGVSLLLRQVFGLPLSVLIVVLNVPFMLMAGQQLGRAVAIRTMLAVLALALVLATVHFPIVTHDKLLISVFGGFFLGRRHRAGHARGRRARWHRNHGHLPEP